MRNKERKNLDTNTGRDWMIDKYFMAHNQWAIQSGIHTTEQQHPAESEQQLQQQQQQMHEETTKLSCSSRTGSNRAQAEFTPIPTGDRFTDKITLITANDVSQRRRWRCFRI